jgi:hypothetical protein
VIPLADSEWEKSELLAVTHSLLRTVRTWQLTHSQPRTVLTLNGTVSGADFAYVAISRASIGSENASNR